MPPEPEETWKNIAARVGGAGASGVVASQVQKFAPQLTTEVAGVGAGFVIFKFGGDRYPILRLVGAGMMAGALMPRIAGVISGIVPKTTTTSSPETGGKTAAELAAQAYAARSA